MHSRATQTHSPAACGLLSARSRSLPRANLPRSVRSPAAAGWCAWWFCPVVRSTATCCLWLLCPAGCLLVSDAVLDLESCSDPEKELKDRYVSLCLCCAAASVIRSGKIGFDLLQVREDWVCICSGSSVGLCPFFVMDAEQGMWQEVWRDCKSPWVPACPLPSWYSLWKVIIRVTVSSHSREWLSLLSLAAAPSPSAAARGWASATLSESQEVVFKRDTFPQVRPTGAMAAQYHLHHLLLLSPVPLRQHHTYRNSVSWGEQKFSFSLLKDANSTDTLPETSQARTLLAAVHTKVFAWAAE